MDCRAAGDHARQIGLARDHLGRRIPVRPLGLARNLFDARPGEALAADADAVADRLAVAEHEIEERVRGIDDDGAGRLVAGIVDDLPLQARIELNVFIRVVLLGRRVLWADLALRWSVEKGEQRLGLRGAARQSGSGDQRGQRTVGIDLA